METQPDINFLDDSFRKDPQSTKSSKIIGWKINSTQALKLKPPSSKSGVVLFSKTKKIDCNLRRSKSISQSPLNSKAKSFKKIDKIVKPHSTALGSPLNALTKTNQKNKIIKKDKETIKNDKKKTPSLKKVNSENFSQISTMKFELSNKLIDEKSPQDALKLKKNKKFIKQNLINTTNYNHKLSTDQKIREKSANLKTSEDEDIKSKNKIDFETIRKISKAKKSLEIFKNILQEKKTKLKEEKPGKIKKSNPITNLIKEKSKKIQYEKLYKKSEEDTKEKERVSNIEYLEKKLAATKPKLPIKKKPKIVSIEKPKPETKFLKSKKSKKTQDTKLINSSINAKHSKSSSKAVLLNEKKAAIKIQRWFRSVQRRSQVLSYDNRENTIKFSSRSSSSSYKDSGWVSDRTNKESEWINMLGKGYKFNGANSQFVEEFKEKIQLTDSQIENKEKLQLRRSEIEYKQKNALKEDQSIDFNNKSESYTSDESGIEYFPVKKIPFLSKKEKKTNIPPLSLNLLSKEYEDSSSNFNENNHIKIIDSDENSGNDFEKTFQDSSDSDSKTEGVKANNPGKIFFNQVSVTENSPNISIIQLPFKDSQDFTNKSLDALYESDKNIEFITSGHEITKNQEFNCDANLELEDLAKSIEFNKDDIIKSKAVGNSTKNFKDHPDRKPNTLANDRFSEKGNQKLYNNIKEIEKNELVKLPESQDRSSKENDIKSSKNLESGQTKHQNIIETPLVTEISKKQTEENLKKQDIEKIKKIDIENLKKSNTKLDKILGKESPKKVLKEILTKIPDKESPKKLEKEFDKKLNKESDNISDKLLYKESDNISDKLLYKESDNILDKLLYKESDNKLDKLLEKIPGTEFDKTSFQRLDIQPLASSEKEILSGSCKTSDIQKEERSIENIQNPIPEKATRTTKIPEESKTAFPSIPEKISKPSPRALQMLETPDKFPYIKKAIPSEALKPKSPKDIKTQETYASDAKKSDASPVPENFINLKSPKDPKTQEIRRTDSDENDPSVGKKDYFGYNISEIISEILNLEISSFLRIIPYTEKEREVDNSIDYILEYINTMAKELKENETEVLDAINIPVYQEPLSRLAMLQDPSENTNKFPTLELILPPELCSGLKVVFQSLDIPSRQIYLQMLFDCVNEALNYIRPFGVKGIPDPWSVHSTILFGESELDNVFARISSYLIKWVSCKSGCLHTPDTKNDDERLQNLREEKMSALLCLDVREEEQMWLEYEEEETLLKIVLANHVLDVLVDEIPLILKSF